MMNKFIQTSINLQNAANNVADSKQAFKSSCNICCSRGIKMDCDRCPIRAHHELVVSVFADLEEFDNNKLQRQQQNQSLQ